MDKQNNKKRTVHCLKTWPPFYREMLNGFKNFDLRKDDRNFKVGDCLILQEFDPNKNGGTFTGNQFTTFVIYKLCANSFQGIENGYCILGIGTLNKVLELEIKKEEKI